MTERNWQVEIDRDNIADARLRDIDMPSPAQGEIAVRLDCFGMTANNVTYAALGKLIGLFGNDKGYWDFFSRADGPGRLPVWGIATVTRSATEGIATGEQFYGYFPLAAHAVLTPGRISAAGFTDKTPHRLDMPSAYNSYLRLDALRDFANQDRDWWPVFRPLYLTGWLIADQFEDEGDYAAEQVIVTSASSKTALSFAQAMAQRTQRPRLVGLTSERGRAFLAGTGLYDTLVLYEAVDTLEKTPSALVDFAGNPATVGALHRHLGDAVKLNLVVGKAHWAATSTERWPARFFFAPNRMHKRAEDWGPGGVQARVAEAWTAFLATARDLFQIDRRMGPEAALAAYLEAVAGAADPRSGVLVTL